MEVDKMKLVFSVLLIVVLSTVVTGRCQYGCSCFSDNDCDYYCNLGMCQNVIPYNGRCSGYYIHPRECGSSSYCDLNSGSTCQFKKSDGQYCSNSYSCISGYCDYIRNVCGTDSSFYYYPWVTPVIVSSVLISVFIILLIVLVRVRHQRRFARTVYANPYVVPPTVAVPSYQNSYPIVEDYPPPYPGPTASSTKLMG